MHFRVHALAAILLAASADASAQVVREGLFSYTGGMPWRVNAPTWEPTRRSPGINFGFYGAPDPGAGCDSRRQDGPITSDLSWTDVRAATGLADPDPALRWSPITDGRCTLEGWQGFTHAHLNPAIDAGGFALSTHTGPKPTDPSPSFWQPYPAAGDRYGANRFIQDTFAEFWFDPDDPLRRVRPFSSPGAASWDVLRVALVSYQHVERITATNPQTQQVRQQLRLNLLNRACLDEGGQCEVELLFYTAMVGMGVPGLFAQPEVFVDPAQAGSIAIVGGIPAYDGTVTYRDRFGGAVPLYTSWAQPTQTGRWDGTKRFQVEISFNQLQNMLRAATATLDGVPLAAAAPCTKYFGRTCRDPNAWQLLRVGVSQEIYNRTFATERASIGGHVTELSVIALPLD